MKIIKTKQLKIYVNQSGTSPFVEWLEQLKDKQIRYRIKERLDRVSLGNFGDHKFIRDGICELRFSFGSGYRVYYGNNVEEVVLLLCGGNKKSQKHDIKKAIQYWQDYLMG